ncbi:hypothetical protein BDM02DRAFT_3127966 [Thelephora ganbajun]|uniref:Uncharacterized protein n=1 Tax=Thelephora ganbajun TaxID=370292 RepID=A0ACB6ZL01_THEGA|nr:hypothetical protein BDM02DRAFT_3127966 [Thelephora ganbajun]
MPPTGQTQTLGPPNIKSWEKAKLKTALRWMESSCGGMIDELRCKDPDPSISLVRVDYVNREATKGVNCEVKEYRVGDGNIVEQEADLTPPSSGTFIRRDRIVTGRDLIGNTLLLYSPSILVLNHAAATLARSTLSILRLSLANSLSLEEGKVPEVPSEGPGDGPLKTLSHLRVLAVTLLLPSLGMVLKGCNFGSNKIDVGHCTWSRSVSTKAFGLEPVRIKVSVELVFSLASFEDEENDQDEGEETDGTSDDTTGDGGGIRRRPPTRVLRLSREREFGGPNCLRLDLAVGIGGPRKHVEKVSVIVPDSSAKKGVYTTTVLKINVEVDEPGPSVDTGVPGVEVVDGGGVSDGELEGGVTTGDGDGAEIVEGGNVVELGGDETVEDDRVVGPGRVAAGERRGGGGSWEEEWGKEDMEEVDAVGEEEGDGNELDTAEDAELTAEEDAEVAEDIVGGPCTVDDDWPDIHSTMV